MRRCAFRGNKKAKYYSVAAILYRVRLSLNKYLPPRTQSSQRNALKIPIHLCAAQSASGTSVVQKLFLAENVFRSSNFISRGVKNYEVNKRGVNPLLPV
jgi:hypothetical protein